MCVWGGGGLCGMIGVGSNSDVLCFEFSWGIKGLAGGGANTRFTTYYGKNTPISAMLVHLLQNMLSYKRCQGMGHIFTILTFSND